jgi:peptide/nickel transport system permease protein
MTVGALAVLAVPEFVVAIGVVILFSTVVFHLFPGVSLLTPGENILQAPRLLVLPALSLTIVTIPYVYRMTRAATLEALESPYVEMARLKGVPRWRVLVQHALPNALPPTIQVVGLTFLRLAGGIVLVEEVFDFPGIGQGLVNAVTDRDIPVIQFIVVVLAAFYVVVNITTDVLALLLSPRRRIPT